MTRLIFLTGEHSLLLCDDPRAPEEIQAALERGVDLADAAARAALPEGAAWRVIRQGNVLIAVASGTGAAGGAGRRCRPRLSPRELEVLQALAGGLSIKEIGRQMGVSTRTVNGTIRQLIARLGVRTREQTVGCGVALRLCEVPVERK